MKNDSKGITTDFYLKINSVLLNFIVINMAIIYHTNIELAYPLCKPVANRLTLL